MEIPETDDGFLNSDDADSPHLGRNVIALEPDTRTWTHRTENGLKIDVKWMQIPLLPDKISTLHGIQGKRELLPCVFQRPSLRGKPPGTSSFRVTAPAPQP